GAGASIGDVVWALPVDGGDGMSTAVAIGHARRGQLGRGTYAGDTCFVDCALIELVDRNDPPAWLAGVLASGWPDETAPPSIDQHVLKVGASTGTTEGVVVDATYRDEPFIDGRSWEAPGQLLINSRDPALNFSGPGDSGAAVLNNAGRLVGLLWGSNSAGQGLACPIAPVLDCLGVRLQPSDAIEGATWRSA